ncbi:MAG TPA: methyltransferase domain-containing protein [Nitrososphaera sp.]|nr:methyltransferase domain-containing protein [Nitrososphaera sp.]
MAPADGNKLALYPRIVVELGMGDGKLIESLARNDSQSLHVGIEIDSAQCEQAVSRITEANVLVLNGSFEQIVEAEFPENSVDEFIAVLPDPTFIDPARHETWRRFYELLLTKLKPGGKFRLVTELTDELLQPVSYDCYLIWMKWLEEAFTGLGFSLAGHFEGTPESYSSRCLDQFRGDPERIRMATFDFKKL